MHKIANDTSVSRPILFSGPMVRAILEGHKTQTRRIVKLFDGNYPGQGADGFYVYANCGLNLGSLKCPYGKPGDRLWVRESHAIYRDAHARDEGYEVILYRADAAAYWNMHPLDHIEAEFNPLRDTSDYEPKWTPSIHMPRWASRITLEITGVRVERLNDISEEDAKSEGLESKETSYGKSDWKYYGWLEKHDQWSSSPVKSFESFWESLNGQGSWALNPWVWVVEFKAL